jgi:putative membrane protein
MSDKNSTNFTKPLIILSLLHIVGLICIRYSGLQEIFQLLAPFHLLIVFGMMLYFQKRWNLRILAFLTGIYLVSFTVEAIGVNTGQIFGQYKYGRTLGIKLFNTPLVIGINWLILTYSTALLVKDIKFGIFGNALLAAFMLVALDVLIEPVAIRTGMWSWVDNKIPIQNYAAWFCLSYIFVLALLASKAKLRNEFAPYVFVIQLAFFSLANLI